MKIYNIMYIYKFLCFKKSSKQWVVFFFAKLLEMLRICVQCVYLGASDLMLCTNKSLHHFYLLSL